MNYSDEQKIIIDACVNDTNVIVDAVAGSGKTTTLIGIAKAQPNKRILGVLFNRSLKEETRERVAKNHLSYLEIHNFHALAKKYYNDDICNDSGISMLLKEGKSPYKKLPQWERIIIDEVQDMNPLYFDFMKKVIRDLNNTNLKLTVMGDRYQSIYAFLNSDSRFLTNAPHIYLSINGPWNKLTLSITYRCNSSICAFLNDCLLGHKRLIPFDPNPAPPVNYIYGSPFEARKVLLTAIMEHLCSGYKPEDIFVLVPSVKMKLKETPVKMLENLLVSNYVPIYIPNENEKDINNVEDGDPTKGKLVITTFHQSKGLERKIVIIYNFDHSYYKIFNKEADPNALSAELYVSTTRTIHHLYVVHDKKQPPFKFFKTPKGPYVRFMSSSGEYLPKLPEHIDNSAPEIDKPRIFHASEMTNYLTADVLIDAASYFTVKVIQQPFITLDLKSLIQTSPGHYETVSDLNGTAIPAFYEWRKRKSMRIASLDEDTLIKDGQTFIQRYHELQKNITNSEIPQIGEILEIANIFTSIAEGYHYKVAQIKNYNWLKNLDIEPCMDILEANLDTDDIQYEVNLPEQTTQTYSVLGRIDAYSESKSTLWEIKCTDKLDQVHEIQLAIYAWMFSKQFPKRFNDIQFQLLNIRTGECRQINSSPENLDAMMTFLASEKMRTYTKMSDEEFNRRFSTNVDVPIQPNHLKQLKITSMIPTTKQPALFLDEDKPVPSAPKKPRTTPVMTSTVTTVAVPPLSINETPTNNIVEPITPDGRVIVFDLETNGLPETPSFGTYYPPEELHRYRMSRIVQWSWSFHEPDGTLIAEEDHIIKPNLAEYRILNEQFHGITETIARVRGKTFEEIMEKWTSHLKDATTIVGHNVNFDKHVLMSELHRRGYPDLAKILLTKKWVCTMERGKQLCGLKARNKLKPPKLCELMHALGIKEEVGRAFHNSKHDVYYTARCYFSEQVAVNNCPKMYDGQHAGKTYEEILTVDRAYAVHSAAACNVHKLYNSPIRKLSNWLNDKAKKDSSLAEEIKNKTEEIRNSLPPKM